MGVNSELNNRFIFPEDGILPKGFIPLEVIPLKTAFDDIEVSSSGISAQGMLPINLEKDLEFTQTHPIFLRTVKHMQVFDEPSSDTIYQSGEVHTFMSTDKTVTYVFMGVSLTSQMHLIEDGVKPEEAYISRYHEIKFQELGLIKTSLERFMSEPNLDSSDVHEFFKQSVFVSSIKDLNSLFEREAKDDEGHNLVTSKAVDKVKEILNETRFNKTLPRYKGKVALYSDKTVTLKIEDDNSNSCQVKVPMIFNGINFSANLWIAKNFDKLVCFVPTENCSDTNGFGTDKVVNVTPLNLEFELSKEESMKLFEGALDSSKSSNQLGLDIDLYK